MGVEMFWCPDEDEPVLINELAPRVHNSGHWTQIGALTDQFAQHIRAIAGLPLGAATLRAPGAEMLNILGDPTAMLAAHMSNPEAQVHLYGKAEARPGRKMGHINRLLPAPPREKP